MAYSHKSLTAAETEEFVIECLQLSNSTYRKTDGGLIEAFVPVKRPPSFFGIEQPPYDRLLMAFGDDPRGLPADAELVSPGSYRLNWFIEGLRSRGRLCQAYVPLNLPLSRVQKQIRTLWPQYHCQHPGHNHRHEDLYLGRFNNRHELYLLTNFKCSLKSDESKEYIDSAAINLINGSIRYDLHECLAASAWPVKDCVHAADVPAATEPEITIEQAFQALIDTVFTRAEEEFGDWRTEPQSRFADELERLEAYYDDHKASGNNGGGTRPGSATRDGTRARDGSGTCPDGATRTDASITSTRTRARANATTKRATAQHTRALTFPANKEAAAEKRHLIAELREKFRPRLIIKWLSAAFLYLPVINYQFEAISAGDVRQGQLRYEPVTGTLIETE